MIGILFSILLLLSPGVKAANFTDNQTVGANKNWTIKFTDEVKFDELISQSINVTDSSGNKVYVGLQLEQGNKTITVMPPQGGYTLGENYILNINNKLHSKKDKALKNEYKLHFNIEKYDNAVTFKDKNFEQAVRDTINKRTGDIYKSDVEKITELSINGKDIQNIGGIENLTNLQKFYSNNEVRDLSPLKNLTSLTQLSFNDSEITDISPLKNLTNLQQLSLVHNRISDISALKDLTDLQKLNLTDNKISDISALRNLVNLESLELGDGMGGNNISDLTPISELKNLKLLSIMYNKISDISALKNLTNLKELFAGLNQISDISPLEGLTNLQTLNLDENQISDISSLQWLSNLQTIVLEENQISDISPLQELSNLQTIYLNNNKISDSDKQSLKNSLPNCNIMY